MLQTGSNQLSFPEYWEDPSTLVSDQIVWFAHRQTSNVWENPTIENFVNDIIRGISDKHINLTMKAPNSFMRMTFIVDGKCYCCEKTRQNIKEIRIDNFLGFNRYGWICCEECKPFVMIDKGRREKKMNCLPYTCYKNYTDKRLKFWRHSTSDPSLEPYLVENAKFEHCSANGFEVRDKYNSLTASVSWETHDKNGRLINFLIKAIPVSNLIFFNRDLFGYNIYTFKKNFIDKCEYINDLFWCTKWLKSIKKHYEHANGWHEFYRIAVRKNIPRVIVLQILAYWGLFNLSCNNIQFYD